MSRSGVKNVGISFVGCIWKWRCVCTESFIKTLIRRLLKHAILDGNPLSNLQWLDLSMAAVVCCFLSEGVAFREAFS